MPGYLWDRETALRSPDGTAARIAPAPLGSRCAHHPDSPAPCSSVLVRSLCPAPRRSSVTISQFLSVLRPWTVPPPLRSWRPSHTSLSGTEVPNTLRSAHLLLRGEQRPLWKSPLSILQPPHPCPPPIAGPGKAGPHVCPGAALGVFWAPRCRGSSPLSSSFIPLVMP